MMKKIRFLVIISVIFFFFPFDVLADTHEISYYISNFTIMDGKFHFEGWSLVGNADNWGGKNLTTYIVVTDGTIEKKYKASPKNGSSGPVDFYRGRCTDGYTGTGGCRDFVKQERMNSLQSKGDYRGGNLNGSCTESRGYGGAHCVYYNIGFSVDVPMLNIAKEFPSDSNLEFYIVSDLTGVNKKVNGVEIPLRAKSKLSIFPGNCGDQSYCSSENLKSYDLKQEFEEDGKKYILSDLTIGGFTKKFKITADLGMYMTGFSPYVNNGSNYYKTNAIFDISTSYGNYGLSNYVDKVTSVEGKKKFRDDILVHLYCSGGSGMISPTPHNQSDCWALSSWGNFEGQLKIKNDFSIDDPDPTPECICFGDSCNIEGSNPASCVEKPINTIDDPNQVIENRACDNADFSAEKKETKTKKYYYRVKVSEVQEKLVKANELYLEQLNPSDVKIISQNNAKVSEDGYVYFPITFGGDLKKVEKAKLSIVKRDNEDGVLFQNNSLTVDAGRYFNFALDYEITDASWSNICSATAKYKNTGTIKVNYSKNGSVNSIDVSFYFDLKDNEQIYGSPNVADKVGRVSEMCKRVVEDTISKESSTFSLDNKLTVEFPDSNAENFQNASKIKPGSFICTTTNNNTECHYNIASAYGTPDGKKYYGDYSSDKKYIPLDIVHGSLYYLPFSIKSSDTFSFNINADDLSIISGIIFKYNATCNLKTVETSIREKLSYRPIDIDNPFPDNNYSKNWEEYKKLVGDSVFETRIKDSYQYLNYETDFLSSKSMNHLESKYGIYSNISNTEFLNYETANSSIISNIDGNFFVSINGRNNHCPIGKWDSDCDKFYQS